MIFQLRKEINSLSRIPRIRLYDIGWNVIIYFEK